MLLSAVLGFVAGFFAGNGLPYYLQGSTGNGHNPSPFRDSPAVSVATGWGAFMIAGAAWWHADAAHHPLPAWLAAAAGVLAVGLIHSRTWRDPDPWGKRTRHALPDQS
ncbi:hypothetical protein ACFFX1_01695 [Dactylosporangium sucinum]|uniref:Uncharacterized protein n=1 Tax=Dactylosporangium sucinum TaxID=1424081 RepID=A0A917T3W5_9ACTN|nr:hypothetical protein [Dactylosporangium sucinum]GGM08807.1 hypothetical protein GCM10007977_007410 [Dactylosporangium sucinum]